MRAWFGLVVMVGCLGLSGPAWAQDGDDFTDGDDDFTFEDGIPEEEEEAEEAPAAEPTPEPTSDEPPPAEEPDEDEFLFEDEIDEEGNVVEEDLFGEERDTRDEVLAPGTDNVTLYRAKTAEVEGMPADEEVMAWETYLEEYPNSVFRERIQVRIDELMKSQYSGRIIREGEAGSDPKMAELEIVHPVHLPNMNPRTKVLAAFELGFPLYTGGILDFEYAPLRQVSVHGGLAGRASGWGLELGARYAFVKSVKAQFAATLTADIRLNFGPLFFQFRPQIGFAKIIGPVQILANFGAEIGTRPFDTVGLIGGVHIGGRVAKPVGIFVESDFGVRQLGRVNGVSGEPAPFAFATVSFGLKFFVPLKKRPDVDSVELAAGGHVPVASTYQSNYQGAAHLQGVYYLDLPWAAQKKR